MKQDAYDVTVAFSPRGIISCKCGCKAGSQLFDKVVCVHTLPVLMQFLIFLIEDLGQNILVELCNRWTQCLDEVLKPQHDSIRSNLLQLMKSIGVPEADLKKAQLSDTIQEMLLDFCVGTEKRKQRPLPPRDDQLCPLKQYSHISTSSSLKKKLVKLVGVAPPTTASSKTKGTTPPKTTLPTSNPPSSTTNTVTSTPQTRGQPPTILKIGTTFGVLAPVVCDFCKNPSAKTTHVCKHEMPNDGPRIIEGETTRICGLAICIRCKFKKMGEVETEQRVHSIVKFQH